jgi:D-alanine-D-alanine ligase
MSLEQPGGHRRGRRQPRLRVAVVHNTDFARVPPGAHDDDPGHAARADVLGAVGDVARALEALGYDVEVIAVDEARPGGLAAGLSSLIARLGRRPPDLVFNLCESLAGDSRNEIVVPALLEALGVRYTGSPPLALGLALRKDTAKELLRAAGVPTPAAVVVDADEPAPAALASLRLPVIVKPTREDASVGITSDAVVHDRDALLPRARALGEALRQPVLVEEYVEGREVYVSLVGEGDGLRALPMHEVDFSAMPAALPRIVSYAAKWDPASVEYRATPSVRAELPDEVRARVEAVARAAFAALGLRDYGRVDVRLEAATRAPFVIDVNPNCDLSDGAGVSRAAAFAGLTHTALIGAIVDSALRRAVPRGLPHVGPAPVRSAS